MRNLNYSFLPVSDYGSLRSLPSVTLPVDTDDFVRMCRLVYAINPRTNLPCSDLQVLFSDSVPDDIKDWVRKNLFNEISGGISSIVNGLQVDDDLLFSLTRNVGESSLDYIDRVDSLLKDMNKSKSEGD